MPSIGLPVEQVRCGLLGGQGKGAKRVHDEVDPEELHGLQGHPEPADRADERHLERNHIHVELELEEAPDVVVHRPAPQHRLHDRGEIVVHDHDVRGLLRDRRSRDTHRQSDVCLLERRSIVGAIACHGHDLPHFLEATDEDQLVLGAAPCHDLQILEHRLLLVWRHLAEIRTLDSRPRSEDATLFRDTLGSKHVVACHHAHHDASFLAGLHGRRDLLAQGVLDPDNTNARHLHLRGVVLLCDGVRVRHIPVGDADGTEALAGHGDDVLRHGLALRFADRLHNAVARNVRCAKLQDDF
mmetsp:Transcript_58777/g.120244  ORF Transcript_58777/g.120244 Transcript_58777/m.120244 type:complete len:298 (+) Transcript_58777:969-1862(+)